MGEKEDFKEMRLEKYGCREKEGLFWDVCRSMRALTVAPWSNWDRIV